MKNWTGHIQIGKLRPEVVVHYKPTTGSRIGAWRGRILNPTPEVREWADKSFADNGKLEHDTSIGKIVLTHLEAGRIEFKGDGPLALPP